MKKPTYVHFMNLICCFLTIGMHKIQKLTVSCLECQGESTTSFLGFKALQTRQLLHRTVLFLALLFSVHTFAQLPVPFTPRLDGGSIKVKGDILFIGNSMVTGKGLPSPYNGTANNNNMEGVYINAASGGDPSIFSSSSADLNIDNSCKKIVYAGLYWASVYPNEVGTDKGKPFAGTPRLEDWNQIKFKLPTGGFLDLVADNNPDPVGEEDDIIFDGYKYYGPNVTDSFKDSPIICYKNVTNLVQSLTEADGTYTVANLRATRGLREGGCSAGWTLVVVYESPIMPSKYITLFDGYAGVQNTTTLDIPVSGFQTLPAPYPVNANISVGALEGDIGIQGDSFQFKANSVANYTVLSDAINAANNFFNSTITINGVHNTNRNPASRNTLGLDINNIKIPNPGNIVIPNDETAGALRLTTRGDGYGAFVTSFSVEIIEPKIVLTKIVEDEFGNNIGGSVVQLGQELNYVLGFRNNGNDDATDFIIRDILPINVVFDYPTDVISLPPGVSVQSYNPATREIIFKIDDSVVEENDPVSTIRFKVTVVATCSLLVDVCSNIINNQAFASYRSKLNPSFLISDDPSYSSNTGCLLSPQVTNFLADLDDCIFTQEEILCGNSLQITAGDGYDSYSWSTSPSGTPVIGTTQTITVTSTGTYYVRNTAVAPCQSIDQIFEVSLYGGNIPNPILPYADEVVTCPNDGKILPNIFLCGANDFRNIQTNISGSSSLIWEKLDEGSCSAVTNSDCANESPSCTWNQVGTGADFLANASGQYRLTINYDGGCFTQFYFNVYQNLLNPTAITKDIICTTPGSIAVGGVPSGYEYSLDGVNYQTSNTFPVNTPGFYTAYIKQSGVTTNPCVFTVPDIQIRARAFTGSVTVIQPFCNGDKGSIQIAANDVDPQYYFSLYQGATLITTVGPIVSNNYKFQNLNPGTYTASLTTDNGCTFSEEVTITNPPVLSATADLTSPLTCTDGEITVKPIGGTPPYFYFVNSATDFQTVPEIVVTAAGTFNITVVDSNNCSTQTTITVAATPAPVFTIATTDILCSNASSGTIKVNVSNANGNSLKYSIDGGLSFINGNLFSGLTAGDYDVVVQYTSGKSVCVTDPQTVTINPSVAIEGTATLTTPYTCTTNGTITVSGVSGGVAPYTYSINGVNFQASSTFSNLTNGNYTVTIKDASSCVFATNSITIAPLNPPTNLTFGNTALTCPANTSTVSITGTTGGTGTLEYQITAPAAAASAYQTSTNFSGLAPGTYTFQVKDANDCTYSESYTIAPLPTISIVAQPINDVTCFGAADGSARFTVSGTSNFTYTVNGGASTTGTSPVVLTRLAAGTYAIVVTDTTTNCTATASTTIASPTTALAVSATVSPLTCSVEGSAVINATGGWGGNQYTLTLPNATVLPTQGSNIFSNLNQTGTYSVTVRDARGCEVSVAFDLIAPTAPTATIAVSSYCYDGVSGTTLEVTAADGQAPYQYNMNGGAFSSNNIFTGLTPGSYSVTVRDAYGCEITLPAEIIQDQLVLTTGLTKDLDCTASSDAVITGTFSGGYAPYTYAVSINGGAYANLGTTGTPFSYTTSNDGSYQFQITDAKGCTANSGMTIIDAKANPSATTTVVNATCNGTNTGAFQIIPSGGVAPYTYSFEGSAFTATSKYTGLAAGTYTYQVKDAKECIFDGSVTITEPTALVASATATSFSCSVSNTSQTAVVTIAVPTTGTAPYTYSFNGSGYTSTNTLTVNDNGTNRTITYSVKDANGCIDGGSVSISPLNPPTDLSFNVSAITCVATTSTVTLTATNGVGALEYETIAPSPIIRVKQTSNSFAGLTPGTYVFRVTDANGCYYTESVTIAPVAKITVTGVKLSDVLCYGDNTGAIRFTVSGFSGAYTSSLTSGTGTINQSGNTIDVTGLVAGSYTVLVTDTTTGCTATETITVSEPADPLGITAIATAVYCVQFESQITATATGGTLNYTYAAVISGNPAPTAADYNASNSITVDTNSGADLNWDVYVKDANGCIATTAVAIVSDALPTVSAPTVSNQCTASSGFTFTAVGTGIAPLSYSINGGASYQDNGTFTVNAAGNYTITIKDGNGCTATSTAATQVFAPITVSALLTQDLSCFPTPDASIAITASGGNAPYTYEVSSDGGTTYNSISGSPYTTTTAGTYQFRITDANGCEKVTASVIVNPTVLPEITAVVVAQDINCNGEETGALTITVDTTKGLAPFVINVLNTTTGTDYGTQTSGLAAGSYVVTVTDAKGCTDTDTIDITEPDVIDFDLTKIDITCNNPGGSSLGSITIENVSGGTGSFTYFITNNFGDVIPGNPYSAVSNENYTFSIINYGIYTINVIDANGCSLSKQITMASPPSDLVIDVTTAVIDCASGGTAVIEAISTVGSGSYEFGIVEFNMAPYTTTYYAPDVSGGAIKTFTNLVPGVLYTFVVHDLVTDCYFVKAADAPIAPASALTSTVSPNNVICTGEDNGSVTFTIDNFDSTTTSIDYAIYRAYTNVLVDGPTNLLVTFGTPETVTTPSPGTLGVGQYYILFTENGTGAFNGCESASAIFEIRESAIDLSLTASVSKNENCNEDGVISATASNGTAPYQYMLLLDTATAPLSGDAGWGSANTFKATADDYTVYVLDAYGCIKAADVTLIKDPEPTIDPVTLPCFDGTAFPVTLTGTTFNTIATYSIGGAYQASPDFTITAAGSYTASIKDANGCIATTTFVVQPPLLLDVSATELDCVVTPVVFTFTPSGGDGVYTYEVSIGGGSYAPISLPYTTTTPGNYQFKVTDSQMCFAESTVVIVNPAAIPTLTETHVDVSCFGEADGSIVITAANGIAPYQYSIDGGTFQTSNVFSGLLAGTYTIEVRDSKSCDSAIISVDIDEPTALLTSASVTPFSCATDNSAQSALVTIVIPTTGTAPYAYSFNGSVYTSTNTLTVNDNGTVQTITYSVRDANGCLFSDSVTILPLDEPTDLDFAATPVTCLDLDSDVTITTTDGVGILTYEIISPASAVGNTTGATTGIFTSLAPDTYVFTVTDANGCYYTEAYTVIPVTNIIVSGTLVADVSCATGNDGAVTFEVANFSGNYSYQINGGALVTGQTITTIPLTGLPAGDQIIVVTDETTGCTATATVTVSEPTAVALTEITNINANCGFGAQVTVEASGGTAPYQYAFVADGVAPVASDYTNSATAVLDPAISLDWDVWVMDSNGCTDQIDVVIATDPLPTGIVPTIASNQCTAASGFEFTVTGVTGIAPFTYSIGNGFQTSPTFTVSAPGTYTVTIKDGNGCTITIPATIEVYPALALTPNITALPSCANNDGIITVSAVGGSGTYNYSISPSPAGITLSGNVFSGVPSGTYTITIEDATTGCTETADITLEAATPVLFTADPTDVSCNGGSDGTITVNLPATNDNPSYTYAITAGPTTRPAQNSNVFVGLLAGVYTVEVNSGRGCVATETVTINEPLLLEASATATDFACAVDNSVNTSVLTITAVGGTTAYEYSIDGVNYFTSNTFDSIDTGSQQIITVYVQDANGCLATNTITIDPLPKITAALVAIASPIDCNATGSVTINVTGGSGNFTYQMLPSGTPQASDTFSITAPGDYYFQVTDDVTGCFVETLVFTVDPFDVIEVEATAATAVTCFGDTNGALSINVSGYTGNYTYEVLDSAGATVIPATAANTTTNPQLINGLSGGNYTVVVTETDSPFCATVTNVVTIASPSAPLTLTALETSNVTCDNDSGTITATANGGWGTYEYELTGAASVVYSPNGTFTGLSAGTYIVNVRDAVGCIASDTVTLVEPTPITATFTPSVTSLSCFGDQDASITVSNVSGGQGSNYTYTLNTVLPTPSSSGPQASPVFSGLGAGTYNITITDGYNCSVSSVDIVIAQPTPIEARLVTATTQTCLTDASLTLSATGGTGLYSYSTSSTFATIIGTFTTSTTFDVTVGTYKYYVRDANGCVATVSNDITINPIPDLTLNLNLTNAVINCAGDNTGVIVATAQGGLGSYVYTLQDASGTPILTAVQNTPGVFTELFAGTYFVQVDSGDCDTTSSAIEIKEPISPLIVTSIQTDVSCFGDNNGVIEINATGGTGVIKYAISPQLNQFFDTNVFENLAPGTYDVIVQDELGCYENLSFTIAEPAPVIVNVIPTSIFPEVCEGDVNGEFSVTISGGTAPYSVSLDDDNGPYTTGAMGQTQFDFTGLGGGDHTVFVRDSLGCESEWNITFPESVLIDPTVEIDYVCENNASGNSVTVNVDASITDLSDMDYALNGGDYQSSNVFNNVLVGTGQYIDVRHTNGCIKRTPLFDINQVDQLTLTIADGGLNEIVATATGGTGDYQFTLNGEDMGSTSSFIIKASGDYTVTVTDSSGCIASATRFFEFIDICIPNYFTPNGDGYLDQWAPGCATNYPNLEFKIFDRYGREVGTYRQGQAWDGKYNSKELPTGDYWYVVKLNDGEEDRDFVGHFTLYR
ncbi:T9SS type B sorting domain-containing protein [Gelidibacter algens]|nr:T9SS type B sorting domain-containing protein [Gelidibacter algens]